jgi:hypothetical protein
MVRHRGAGCATLLPARGRVPFPASDVADVLPEFAPD